MAEREERPSQGVLLVPPQPEARGRLKMFLGSALGFGKIHEMMAVLTKQLRAGKVYIPQQAERAVRHFFSTDNSTASCEPALRRTAQRVGPWPVGERLLVCIGEAPTTGGLVRYARRVADHMQAPWTAIYVETARPQRMSDAERDRIADQLRLAEQLGASTVTIPGRDIADEIVAYAVANNITQIVIGKSDRPRWFEFVHGSVVHDLVRKTGQIGVHVISVDDGEAVPAKSIETRPKPAAIPIEHYLGSAAVVFAALGVGLLLKQFVAVQSISLVFITAVLVAAAAWGLLPSLFASLLSLLAFNFFFLPPLYTLSVADAENVVALFFFLTVAIIVSNLTAATRRQIVTARARAKTTAALYAFSRKVAGIGALDDLLWATAYQISSMLNVRTVLLMPVREGDGLEVASGYPPEDRLDEADMAAARWSWDRNRPAGRGADTLPGGKRLFLPLRTGSGPVGVIGIDRDAPGPLLTPDERRLLDALCDQAAIAIERISLARGLDEARVLAETERLRAALLTSISHDLRTPLASILGTVSSLRSYPERYGEADRADLLATLQEEAERLNRFVANLLDMTRLESGVIELNLEVIDVSEIVGAAVQRAGGVLSQHHLEINVEPGLPMLRIDAVLFEQVLFNLLDNASKYSPAGSRIDVRATRDGDLMEIEVADEGPGIPPGDLERIFDKFYRVQAQDRRRAGTGLGLGLCRGFVEALGGWIVARNRRDRPGAVLTIRMPVVPELAAPRQPATAYG